MKPATVLISGRPPGENLKDIEVPSGATALDVLTAVGLDRNWTLSREGTNQSFALEEECYAAIDEGCKLRATPQADVGANWFLTFIRKLGLCKPRTVVTQTGSSQVRSSVAVVEGPKAIVKPPEVVNGRIQVGRDTSPLHVMRGWRRKGNKLFGAYRLGRLGSWAGEIHLSIIGKPTFFITNPPKEVFTSHGPCFRRHRGDVYAVHFGIGGAGIDDGIVGIEKLISRSLSRKGDRR